MAGAKEIRTKIRSVQNTQKITKAMEMVAASKMRKAQDRMAAARPYADKIRQVIAHVRSANAEYKHPYLSESEQVRRVGYIVVSTDRGLCGGLNSNTFRMLTGEMRAWHEKGVEIDVCCIGTKAMQFFNRVGGNVVAQVNGLGDKPSTENLVGTVKVMLDAYIEGRVDRVYLVFNRFINSMSQQAQAEQLLPRVASDAQEVSHHWDYLYEPEAAPVLDFLLDRYVESLVYQGVVENIACEMAARMVAMKSASDNAGELIGELNLAYNKARQAAITQELSEIVSGAAAV
ncbi:MAG: F0F1 ATP synthase subunit gamma [Chromatiales bacterium]|jgi:F-type H+-transporting ATPase subunit gamma|nr:F0F1 ATP synthase subunit gamma [Chromatiales bacterium]